MTDAQPPLLQPVHELDHRGTSYKTANVWMDDVDDAIPPIIV